MPLTISNPRFCYINPASNVQLCVRRRLVNPIIPSSGPGRPKSHAQQPMRDTFSDIELFTVPVRLQYDTVNCIMSTLSTEDRFDTNMNQRLFQLASAPSNETQEQQFETTIQEVSLHDLQVYADILRMPCLVIVNSMCDLDTQDEYHDVYFKRPVLGNSIIKPLRYH